MSIVDDFYHKDAINIIFKESPKYFLEHYEVKVAFGSHNLQSAVGKNSQSILTTTIKLKGKAIAVIFSESYQHELTITVGKRKVCSLTKKIGLGDARGFIKDFAVAVTAAILKQLEG